MLSYQHEYHAGNFADVVKHLTLSRIFNYLCQKEKPVFYLETHSGRGRYDLQSQQALKTGEASGGIGQLWSHREKLSDVFLPYLNTIHDCNPNGELRYYPGSPLLALHQLRPIDRLFCCELHPQEFHELQKIKTREMKIHIRHSDGLQQLPSLLPPPERRGLVFIDPSYEMKTDYQFVPECVGAAYQRFNTGVYCIWYPIIDKKWHLQLVEHLSKLGVTRFLRVEFYLTKQSNLGMTGCGLWVINPPYVLASELVEALDELVKVVNPGGSSYSVNSGPN
jgi:23S rRNA (adenine2030-N6)-methyltransferase